MALSMPPIMCCGVMVDRCKTKSLRSVQQRPKTTPNGESDLGIWREAERGTRWARAEVLRCLSRRVCRLLLQPLCSHVGDDDVRRSANFGRNSLAFDVSHL